MYVGFSPALISSPDLIGVLVYIKRESNNTAKSMESRKTLLSTTVDILSCLPGVFLFRGRDRAPHVRGCPTLAGTLGDLRVCPVHVSSRRPWSWSQGPTRVSTLQAPYRWESGHRPASKSITSTWLPDVVSGPCCPSRHSALPCVPAGRGGPETPYKCCCHALPDGRPSHILFPSRSPFLMASIPPFRSCPSRLHLEASAALPTPPFKRPGCPSAPSTVNSVSVH